MKTKKFKIKIQNLDDFMEDFENSWQGAERGTLPSQGFELVLSFPDWVTLSRILSPERLRLLRTIRDSKPDSIYQLSKLLKRAQPNVQKDVQELAAIGIIELQVLKSPKNKRSTTKPLFKWSGFEIAV